MNRSLGVVSLMLMLGVAAPAMATLTVTSFDTQAQTNAYAPLDRSAYFDTNDQPNISPASASVSDDWSGTNIGGSTNTWHMVTSANISTTTTIDANSLTITGGGVFSYDLSTTAGFIDPTRVTTVYTPGANAGFGCSFTIDKPENYTLTAQLNHLGSVSLTSSGGGIVFQQLNLGTTSQLVNASGVLSPGQYLIGVGANNYGPSGLPNGVNHIVTSGSLSNFSFTVQVPEPTGFVLAVLIPVMLARRPSGC
jgi:hypothetical protein